MVASLAALDRGDSREPRPLPRALRGELDPVDNRAPAEDGGRGPGELGGRGADRAGSPPTADGRRSRAAARDPAADALLSEILPTPPSADAVAAGPARPADRRGLGVLPGPGRAGAAGPGAAPGAGSAAGSGRGPSSSAPASAPGSFAYVIDCSGSMANRDSLDVAKRELLASLDQLPPDAQFGVVFYNLHADDRSPTRQGRTSLMAATADQQGPGPHAAGRRSPPTAAPTTWSPSARPWPCARRSIFFLTDADLMTEQRRAEILARGRHDPDPGRRVRPSAPTSAARSRCAAGRRHRRHVPLYRRARTLPPGPPGSRRDADRCRFRPTPFPIRARVGV